MTPWVGGAPTNNWPIREQLIEDRDRYRSRRKGSPPELSSAVSCGLTIQEKPHMALSGVECSRPLFISKVSVTLSPSTCSMRMKIRNYQDMKYENENMGIKTREWRYKNKFTYMSINNLKIRKHKIHVNVLVHVWEDKILQHKKLINYMYMYIICTL